MDKGLVKDRITELARVYRNNPVALGQALFAYVETVIEAEERRSADVLAKRYCYRQCAEPAGLMCRACFDAIAKRAGRSTDDLLKELAPSAPIARNALEEPIEVEPLPEEGK